MRKLTNCFCIGTFNARGLSDENKQELTIQDAVKYKLDVCCLQETKIKEGVDQDICKSSYAENQHYGLGFIVSEKWKKNILKYWKVSERIAVIQLKLRYIYICEKADDVTVYASTSEIARKGKKELENLYGELKKLIENHKKNTLVLLLAGGFNAKIGKYKKNSSNESIMKFVNRREERFRPGTIEDARSYNGTLINARSYNGTLTSIDHGFLICKMNIPPYHLYKNKKKLLNKNVN